ncbi:hypothetical protein [Mucilaginibacter kameinonensis]|uniref:hypothetical protein n=1 Tax=Mucilaginibacter kameinonensis TaxID=452286 RepID=UPI0013CF2BE8|nr:hypothetical protein [Mucilaginibacter kameinonensis]
MKRYNQTIKQYVVLSLLVIYQFVGWVHLAYLPRQNYASGVHSASTIDFLHKNTNANLPRVQFQRSFHSVDESRKDLKAPSKLLVLFFAFLLTGSLMFTINRRPDSVLASVYSHTPSSYLSLRTLRI